MTATVITCYESLNSLCHHSFLGIFDTWWALTQLSMCANILGCRRSGRCIYWVQMPHCSSLSFLQLCLSWSHILTEHHSTAFQSTWLILRKCSWLAQHHFVLCQVNLWSYTFNHEQLGNQYCIRLEYNIMISDSHFQCMYCTNTPSSIAVLSLQNRYMYYTIDTGNCSLNTELLLPVFYIICCTLISMTANWRLSPWLLSTLQELSFTMAFYSLLCGGSAMRWLSFGQSDSLSMPKHL